MTRRIRIILILAFTMALALAGVKSRYYHKEAKDYHEWTATEERAYYQFMAEKRRTQHDFSQASGKEREEFWNWRHAHPDAGKREDEKR